MARLSGDDKKRLKAVIAAFNFSGFAVKLDSRIVKYYKSFVGRNFKTLAQCALFIFKDFFSAGEKAVYPKHVLEISTCIIDFI